MSVVSIPDFSIVSSSSSVTCTPIPLPSSHPAVPSSSTDRDILDYILEPSLQNGPLLPSNPLPISDPTPEASSLPSHLVLNLQKLQAEGIRQAEAGSPQEALSLFTDMLCLAPHYAPAFNNRAYTHLLLHNQSAALEDLNAAIQYAGREGVTMRQALTQRGLVYREQGREEEAKVDFREAARLGSSVARQCLVALNPYAALCNAMLSRAMQAMREGREE